MHFANLVVKHVEQNGETSKLFVSSDRYTKHPGEARRDRETFEYFNMCYSPSVRKAAKVLMVQAIGFHQFDIGVALIQNHLALPNSKNPVTGKTLLHVASALASDGIYEQGDISTQAKWAAAEVLNSGFVNPNARDRRGNTPLILACKDSWFREKAKRRKPWLPLVKRLLAWGGDPMLKNRAGYSAVGFAWDQKNEPLLRLLLTGNEHGFGPCPEPPASALNPRAKRTAAQLVPTNE